ncbi:MAG TPA: NADH-quinone oxidoreductase subunit M [Gemmatirosa sp.]|nr:NADH-quinone oxidoreductase subunit M [Gemmatirosa sp.]
MRDLLAALSVERWVLPALLTWPLIGAALVLGLGRVPEMAADGRASVARGGFADVRNLALVVLIGEAVLALGLWVIFEPGIAGWQGRVDLPWIPEWGARLSLGVDGLSLVMIAMTALLMPFTVLGSWRNVGEKPKSYYALLLVLMTGTIGVFTALDLLLFYVCWELVLVPMFFMIGISGGARRQGASVKYFIYTTLGSLLMLVAIIALWVKGGQTSFDRDTLLVATRGALTLKAQLLMFGGFFLAFAIKSAFFPFHTWMPDAQHEAPISGAVALGVKVGTYGMLRFALPLFPAAVLDPTVRTVIVAVAVAGILYGALVAMVQPDLKRLASYASVSHLGFVVLGIFALTPESIHGAMVVMLNHGISMGALFLLVGMLQDRRGTGLIPRFGGLARVAPMLGVLLVLVTLSTVGLPATNGFVGEFLVLLGTFRTYPVAATVATVGVILAAVYLLRAVQRVLFGPLDDEANRGLPDLDGRELVAMTAFAVAILWLGVAPGPVLRRMEGPIQRLIAQVQRGGEAAPEVAAAPDLTR